MISIFIASLISFIFGAIWYMGPIGKVWLKSKIWADQDNPKWKTGGYMARMYGTSFVLTMIVAYTLSVFFVLFDAQTLVQHLQIAWLLCFGFVVTTKFNDLIYTNTPPFWSRRAQIVFLADSGYYIGVFTILAAALYYLPW